MSNGAFYRARVEGEALEGRLAFTWRSVRSNAAAISIRRGLGAATFHFWVIFRNRDPPAQVLVEVELLLELKQLGVRVGGSQPTRHSSLASNWKRLKVFPGASLLLRNKLSLTWWWRVSFPLLWPPRHVPSSSWVTMKVFKYSGDFTIIFNSNPPSPSSLRTHTIFMMHWPGLLWFWIDRRFFEKGVFVPGDGSAALDGGWKNGSTIDLGSLAEIDHLLDDDYEDQSSVHLFFVKYKYKHKYKTNTIDHLPDDDYDGRSSVHSLSPEASWPSLKFGIKEQEGGAT